MQQEPAKAKVGDRPEKVKVSLDDHEINAILFIV